MSEIFRCHYHAQGLERKTTQRDLGMSQTLLNWSSVLEEINNNKSNNNTSWCPLAGLREKPGISLARRILPSNVLLWEWGGGVEL